MSGDGRRRAQAVNYSRIMKVFPRMVRSFPKQWGEKIFPKIIGGCGVMAISEHLHANGVFDSQGRLWLPTGKSSY